MLLYDLHYNTNFYTKILIKSRSVLNLKLNANCTAYSHTQSHNVSSRIHLFTFSYNTSVYTQQTSTNLMYYIISKHQMNEIHSQLVHVLVESMILSWCCSTISASSMRTMPLRQFQCCCLTERQHTVLRAAQFFLATYLRIASV